MTNDKIDILCSITYVYKKEKLAVVCPIGKMQEYLETFNIEKLEMMFNAPINFTYPGDAINNAEDMLEPIVKGLDREPDDAYSTVMDIVESDTNNSLVELKNEFDKLYPIEKRLKDEGYKILRVLDAIHSIESFKDSKDVESDDNNCAEIIKIKQEDFDLESFIKYMRTVSKDKVGEDETPTLLERYSEDFGLNQYISEYVGEGEIIDIANINKYLSETEDSAIGFIFGYYGVEENIELITGETIPYYTNVGDMKFYDDTAFAFTIELTDGYYIFKACELYLSYSSYIILKDVGDLKNLLLDVILKYKK